MRSFSTWGIGKKGGSWVDFFKKSCHLLHPKSKKIHKIGWNRSKKGHLGVSGPSSGSKLRCECNGMPPGGQNGQKKLKNPKNPEQSRKSRISIFSYRSLSVPTGPFKGSAALGAARSYLKIPKTCFPKAS